MNWRKINLYLLLSFSISWLVALVMYLAHIEYGTIPASAIMAILYMPGPALATWIIQKFIYKESFKSYGWTIEAKRMNWVFYTVLIFLTLLTTAFLVILILGNTHLIPQFGEISFSQETLNNNLKDVVSRMQLPVENKELPELPPVLFFILSAIQGVIGGATRSLPFMFGEEFGWRGLLLRETQKLGFTKANLFIGLVWGLWHAPVILMGHNYPNHPYFGIIMMCLFTTSITPLFGYVRLKTKSIVGPCMLHGMLNATATLLALYIANSNELFSSMAGFAGIIAGTILSLCIYLFDKSFVSSYPEAE